MEHLRITVAGKVYDVVVERIDGDEADSPPAPAPVARAATPAPAPRTAAAPAPAAPPKAAGEGDATSPLAGLVQAVSVAVGATVNEGDPVITLEAMKMYTSINAASSGTIEALHVKVGDSVEEGQVLYTIR